MQIILDKGRKMTGSGRFGFVGPPRWQWPDFIAFLIQQLRDPHPITNLRNSKDRNFTLGCLIMTLFGGVIYGLVTILPLFYQTVLGYSARTRTVSL